MGSDLDESLGLKKSNLEFEPGDESDECRKGKMDGRKEIDTLYSDHINYIRKYSSLILPVEICSCDSGTAAETFSILLLLGFLRATFEVVQGAGHSQKETPCLRAARKVQTSRAVPPR